MRLLKGGTIRKIAIAFCLPLLLASPVAAAEDFASWLAALREEAAAQGISEETLRAALDGLQPNPRVVELDRRQPEFTRTFSEYAEAVVSEKRTRMARERFGENRQLLAEVSDRYGVPPRILVALWGVESLFGTRAGEVPIVTALATLAFDGRRSAFFRRELIHALRILDEGHIDVARMTGSWAGAMGQFQFMPSTFQRFAVDHDGDGRKDIWGDHADALASAANYLRSAGWQTGVGWGQQVRLPKKFNYALAGLDKRKSYAQWRKLGVRDVQGPAGRPASLLLPEGAGGPAFLVTDNFRVLLAWNRSHSFALTVGLLADRLIDHPGGQPPGKKTQAQMTLPLPSGKLNVKGGTEPPAPEPAGTVPAEVAPEKENG